MIPYRKKKYLKHAIMDYDNMELQRNPNLEHLEKFLKNKIL